MICPRGRLACTRNMRQLQIVIPRRCSICGPRGGQLLNHRARGGGLRIVVNGGTKRCCGSSSTRSLTASIGTTSAPLPALQLVQQQSSYERRNDAAMQRSSDALLEKRLWIGGSGLHEAAPEFLGIEHLIPVILISYTSFPRIHGLMQLRT